MEVSDERILHLETGLAQLTAEVAGLHRALDDIKQRIQAPKLGVQVTVAGTVAVVLLTIGTMAIQPLYRQMEVLTHKMENHADGHPESVRDDIRRIVAIIQEEHDEQEEDIEQLREVARDFELRSDKHAARLSEIETTLSERTRWVEEFVTLRSADRWTGSQQKEFEKRQEHVTEQLMHEHDRLEDRIRVLENHK